MNKEVFFNKITDYANKINIELNEKQKELFLII